MEDMLRVVGAFAGAFMPVFNISMILKIVKRRSSKDISLVWCTGVWVCILLMTPASMMTDDITLKAFGISNLIFFTIVFACVWRYR